jgi:hypothetical protein
MARDWNAAIDTKPGVSPLTVGENVEPLTVGPDYVNRLRDAHKPKDAFERTLIGKWDLGDNEWCTEKAKSYDVGQSVRNGQSEQFTAMRLQDGLIEGRRRSAEECKPFTQATVDKLVAWMHDPNRPSVNITFDLITEGFARVIAREFEVQQIDARQREQAAAREMAEILIERSPFESHWNSVVQETMADEAVDWWKQRKSQRGKQNE